MFMNQAEIEGAVRASHACPNVRKGVKLIHALMESVNAQSDGWAYWSPPSHSCEKLIALLETATKKDGFRSLPFCYGTTGTISDADLKKAIIPIRRMVTFQKKKQAKFGNTFDFDVDAALADPVDQVPGGSMTFSSENIG